MRRPLKRVQFTKEGLEKLKKDYETLFARRPDAVKSLKTARDMGDLSENGLYKAARMELSSIDANLRRLSYLIKAAEIKTPASGVIGIGSKVLVEQNGKEAEYSLVGDFESDPLSKKVSANSPIGAALNGRRTGDIIEINTPNGKIKFKIVKIS